MNKNSLLSMQDLSAEQILSILGDAKSFNSSHKDWQLPKHNALVANLPALSLSKCTIIVSIF